MISEHDILLMNGEIDGTNTQEQSADLQQHLAASPEARIYFQELKESLQMLENSQELDPPSDLRDNIMKRIEEAAASQAVPKTDGHRARIIRFPFRPAHAWSFAAGLAAGVLLFAAATTLWTDNLSPERDSLYGAIGIGSTIGMHLPGSPWVTDTHGFKGSVAVRETEAGLVAQIKSDRSDEIQIVLQHDQAIQCAACSALDAPIEGLATEAEQTTLTVSGEGEYRLAFTADQTIKAPFHVQIVHEGEVVAEHSFQPGSH